MRFIALFIAVAVMFTAPLAQAQHRHEISAPTERLGAQTQAQIETVRESIERYRDFTVAEREGWKLFGGEEPLMGGHWYPPNGPDYVYGDDLDFSRPNNLIYATIDGQRVLTGVAFVVRLGPDEPVPEGFAGSADRWHVHDFVEALEAALEGRPILRWLANWWLDANYRRHGDNRGRLAMAHVWVTEPNPDGVFADQHRLIPYIELGLPRSLADGASVAAARGLHLATEQGCEETIEGHLWIANATAAQSRVIATACAAARRDVEAAVAAPDHLNHVAEAAWERFDSIVQSTLTDEQRARVASMTEHGQHH